MGHKIFASKYLQALCYFSFFAASSSLLGATFTVTNSNDSGAGSLRQAIIDGNASPGSVISFMIGPVALMDSLPPIGPNITSIDSNGNTVVILGGQQSQGFFVYPAATTLTISNNIAFDQTASIGGNGGGEGSAGGGGALGAGGGLFVGGGTNVTIGGVVFNTNSAQGGNGGTAPLAGSSGGGGGGMNGGNGGDGSFGGGGGGGYGGNGGSAFNGGLAVYAGGGGGGLLNQGGAASTPAGAAGGGGGASDTAAGFAGTQTAGGNGAPGSVPAAGAGGAIGNPGGTGGSGSGTSGGGGGGPATSNSSGAGGAGGNATGMVGGGGGGGAGDAANTTAGGPGGSAQGMFGGGGGGAAGGFPQANGTAGGSGALFGGGGGGGGTDDIGSNGGAGGAFGGGGGGGAALGGKGGFGAGGGAGNKGEGAGGFGASIASGGVGGGGAGMGGAIFVQNGGRLNISDPTPPSLFINNTVAGGNGGSPSRKGSALGPDLFLMSGSKIFFNQTGSIAIASAIASDIQNGGGTGGEFHMAGVGGTLQLGGANTFTGTLFFDNGTVQVSSDANFGFTGSGSVPATVLEFNGGNLELIGSFPFRLRAQ